MKKLIITEKPSVAQQFAKAIGSFTKNNGYLENDEYIITWCVGHLVTMSYPEKYDPDLKSWKLDTLPFLPDKYKYEVISDVKEQFKVVKAQLNRKDVSVIYNAGDSGREGEYIQRLVYEMAGHNQNAAMKRIWIDSQTDEAIRYGIRDAKDASEYDSLSDSAYMRAIEDYAIGINFSRTLSCIFGYEFNKKIKSKKYKPISVGRVMTCVLGMIVERERQIRGFKSVPFYGIEANCGFTCKWKAVEGSKFFESPHLYNDSGFKERKHAELLEDIFNKKKVLMVREVKRKTEKKKAPLLYNLAELQNECTQRFKISPDQTLEIAQKLYESKLTTYPRTDARVISTPVAKEIVKTLSGLFKGTHKTDCVETILENGWYSGIESSHYCDDSKITDHYAIIPTGQVDVSGLSELELDVYHLIVERFLSIFYPPAEYDKVEIVAMHSSKEKFFASEKVLVNPGYLDVIGYKKENSTSDLFNIKEKDLLQCTFSIKEGQTTPPKRYNTGNLILAMENAGNLIEDEELRAQIKGSGIGTSATRADIIKKLIKIGYITLNQKTQIVTPHPDGEAVYEIVKAHIPAMLSPEMTASWEKGLAQIADREITKEKYLDILNNHVSKTVNTLKTLPVTGPSSAQNEHEEPVVLGKCPLCGGDIVTTKFGCGCSNYKDTKCWFAVNEYLLNNIKGAQFEKLLAEGKTDVIDTFKSKKGSSFSAYVIIDHSAKKVDMKMPERSAQMSDYKCPACEKASLFKYDKSLECNCGFRLYTNICEKDLEDEQINALLDGQKVKVCGMTSKKKKKFDAFITMDPKTGKTKMEFE